MKWILRVMCFILFVLSFSSAEGQQIIKCNKIRLLLNFNEIKNNFKGYEIADTVYILDVKKIIKSQCLFDLWNYNKAIISHDSILLKKAIKGISASSFKGNNNYFVFDNYRVVRSSVFFTIYRAATNEFINCRVKKIGSEYRFYKLDSGVY